MNQQNINNNVKICGQSGNSASIDKTKVSFYGCIALFLPESKVCYFYMGFTTTEDSYKKEKEYRRRIEEGKRSRRKRYVYGAQPIGGDCFHCE